MPGLVIRLRLSVLPILRPNHFFILCIFPVVETEGVSNVYKAVTKKYLNSEDNVSQVL